MSKLSIKPGWFVLLALLAAALLAIRMAFAIATFTPDAQPVGYVAQDELTSFDLRSGKEVLYRGQYEREFWGGDLIAYNVNAQGDVSKASLAWDGAAAHILASRAPSSRRIGTLHSDGSKVAFTWGTLSASQRTSLSSEAVLNYLRGERADEGTLRRRGESPLGAVVHSRPIFLKDIDGNNPTVIVGANDGMLHAFNATLDPNDATNYPLRGEERWAYVPSMLIPKLKSLSEPAFVSGYFVDGTPNVGRIKVGGATRQVLVGGLGAGGKGLFALDLTEGTRMAPTTDAGAAANILWEITPTTINNVANASYANLGFTYAAPTIAKLGGVDVVIVGNGYNNGGDFQAYLYVINAYTGALIRAIKAAEPSTAGTGTAGSPNGLWTPKAVDVDNDGNIDIVYAGDLNGTMWKFDMTLVSPTAKALFTTSPAQPITTTPGVAAGPGAGLMVTFATGAMFTAANASDATTVYAAYGIWDGAPEFNTLVQTQTLTERCYTAGTAAATTPCTNRVRTVSNNTVDYSTGVAAALKHKGWKIPLPAGERVVGDSSFIESRRMYFTAHNPTLSKAVESSTVYGENWLMEVDYLTGGSKNLPFLDLSGNHILDDDDRVKDTATPRAPVMTTDGIPVGKFLAIGVVSQPVLVQLSSLNNTLFNQNPDVQIVPASPPTAGGVTGGHFDQDIFYGATTAGASAVATITIGSTGQQVGFPATLGAISVNGVTIVPALTVIDLVDGTAVSTNANTIKNKVVNGFTATLSGAVLTITAPAGSEFNGKAITVAAGTAQTPLVSAVPGAPAVGSVRFTYNANSGTAQNVTALTIAANGETIYSGAPGSRSPKTLDDLLDGVSSANYTISKNFGNDHTIKIQAKSNGAAFNGPISVSITTNGVTPGFSKVDMAGGVTAISKSGWTNFFPAVTTTAFNTAGVDPSTLNNTCVGCTSKKHYHQYDDTFDVTGVNMLNPSSPDLDISKAIPSLSTPFKVLAQNQYLSPAVKLHIGNPSYLPNLDVGYIRLRDYTASPTLVLSSLQTYVRNPGAAWPGAAVTDAQKLAQPKPIGSLAINMPVDALTGKDWWGNGDVRSGLHPTVTGCVKSSKGATDGNMYQPVIPPANGVEGPGVNGWSATTTPATAKGVRHNGALTIQIIRADTPDSAIEMSLNSPETGTRPEYGWRVKSEFFAQYVLAEWTTFWHASTPCYGASGWKRVPPPESSSGSGSAPAGTTDPKIGDLGVGGVGGVTDDSTVSRVTTDVLGPVTTTTIFYLDGKQATIVRTANTDGSVTIVVTAKDGKVTETKSADRRGSLIAGGDERGLQAKTGRISWRELVAP